MPKLFLTDHVVFVANCPAGKDQEIFWDHAVATNGQIRNGSVSGLGVRITALGRKAFVHAYQFNGRRCRRVLGSPVTLTVAGARLMVIARDQQIKAAEDPDLDRVDTRRKHFMTVREAIDRYWESHVSGLSKGYQENFAIYMAQWLRRAPRVASRRGHNIKRRYKDFGTIFENRSFSAAC